MECNSSRGVEAPHVVVMLIIFIVFLAILILLIFLFREKIISGEAFNRSTTWTRLKWW